MAFANIMAVVALVLMPLSMAAAPANAHPVLHKTATEPCDQNSREKEAPTPKGVDCAAMCTTAPPIAEQLSQPHQEVNLPLLISLATVFDGIVHDVATPPPKFS